MDSSSVVTVITPVFNQQNSIKKILDGVKGLTYRPLRLIVVDMGSSDDSVKLTLEWFTSHRNQELECFLIPKHRSNQKLKSLEKISSSKKLWLNPGEILAPDALDYFFKENQASLFNCLLHALLSACVRGKLIFTRLFSRLRVSL